MNLNEVPGKQRGVVKCGGRACGSVDQCCVSATFELLGNELRGHCVKTSVPSPHSKKVQIQAHICGEL